MKTISIALLSLLVACSTTPKGWEKSGAPMSQVDTDKAQCEYEAKAATASYRTTPSADDAKQTGGMGTAVGDGIVIAEKQIDLTNTCMRARGYVPR